MNWITYVLEYCTENGVFDKEKLVENERKIVEAILAGDRDAEDLAFAALEL